MTEAVHQESNRAVDVERYCASTFALWWIKGVNEEVFICNVYNVCWDSNFKRQPICTSVTEERRIL